MNNKVKATVSEMLEDWRLGSSYEEKGGVWFYVIAMFDHDYQQHLLLSVHTDETETLDTFVGYSLWFSGQEGVSVPVCEWDSNECSEHDIPFVEASVIVHEWKQMCIALIGNWGDK